MEVKPVRKNIKKRLLRIILNTVVVFLCIPLALTLLFRNPMVQTLSARMVTEYLSSQINSNLSIKSININISEGITLTGVVVADHHGQTMIKVDRLTAKAMFGDLGLFGLRFSKMDLDGPEFRLRRYAEDKDFNLNIFINEFSKSDTIKKDKDSRGNFKLLIGKLKLVNGLFQLYDEHKEYDNGDGMDYANMIFDSIFINANHFSLINDSLNLIIDSLATAERSGMHVKQLKAHFSISKSGLIADDLKLLMDDSDVDMDLKFITTSYKTFGYFIDSVQMYGKFRPSTIKMSNIGYFAEELNPMQNKVGVTGEVSGTVADLYGKDLKLKYRNNTRFSGNGRISGLPDFFTSQIDAEIIQFESTTCDLKSFSLPIDERNLDFTKEFNCNDPLRVSGNFKGSYYDFVTNLTIENGPSHLRANISFTSVENDTLYFSADLKGDSINIGKILHQEETLGYLNLDTEVNGYGNTMEDLYLSTSGLFTSVDLMGYTYTRISAITSYFEDTLKADLKVGDKHLMMSANGLISFQEDPYLKLDANIRRIDLDNIKIWEDKDIRLQTIASVEIKSFDISRMSADIKLSDSKLLFGKEEYSLNQFQLNKYIDDNGLNMIKINSDIVDLEMTGKYDIVQFPNQIMALLNEYYNAFPVDTLLTLPENEFADIEINLKKSNLIEEQFLAGVELYPPLTVQSKFDFNNNILDVESSHDKLGYRGILFTENALKLFTKDGRVNMDMKSDYVIVKDSTEESKTVLGLDELHFTGELGFDLFKYGLYWDNKDSLVKNLGAIEGYLQRYEESSKLKLTHTNIYVSDTLWTVDNNNVILADSSGINFQDVNIFGGISEMKVAGMLPQKNGDSLTLFFNRWNLSNFDFIASVYNFDVDGIVLGDLNVSIVNDHPTVVSDVTIEGLYLNKEYLGTASLLNTWDNVNSSIYVNSHIVRDGSSGEGEVFGMEGYYFPFKDEESLDLDINFSRFKLKAIEPFVADFVSELEGQTSGVLSLRGSLEKPLLTGKMDMRRTSLLINYLNTKYSFSNEIRFDPTQINFDDLVIYDTLGNFANVVGKLYHNYFSDPRFDVKISTKKLLFLNTTRKMNDLYYGSALTSGNIQISGSPKKIKLAMDVTTQDGTDVKLPLDYSVEISEKDYIIFVEHIDSLDIELEELEGKAKIEKEELKYDITLDMGITPNAMVTIFMPSDMGRIESKGKGDLVLKTNSTGDLSLVGDYVLEDGIFHFSLASLVRKRFDLLRGGRISWTGDPYTANVNIRGLYRVRTNISSLGIEIDSSSSYANKVNVECYIILKNQLLNPDIRFEIKFPDLDPDIRRRVYSELDTTNQAIMNEQMISLLVLGSFSSSNAANLSLGSAPYTVISNQLSSMLSRISDDFDIGINYKPGEEYNEEEFEVALSTQLFDDRLIIDGQVGMTYDKSSQSSSNIVGDVDVGYKLTEEGRWILKAFNHSNVNSWYNSYDKVAPYTQGVGIAFRKEFTNIAELFKRTRPKKKKKSETENNKEGKPENE